MLRAVSLLISLLTVCGLATPSLAQRTVCVGVSAIPAINRTLDVDVEVGDGKNIEFFGQVGHMPNVRCQEPELYYYDNYYCEVMKLAA